MLGLMKTSLNNLTLRVQANFLEQVVFDKLTEEMKLQRSTFKKD